SILRASMRIGSMSRTEVVIQRGKLAVIVVNGGSSSIIPIQVSAVPFDMDGVLFNIEEPLRSYSGDLVSFMGTGRLIVADTNNSLIRYLDLNMEQAELQTSELKGVEPPASKSESLKRLRNQSSADKRQLKLMVVHPVRATCVSKYHYLKSTISQRLAIVSKMRSAYINHLSEIPFQLRSFRLYWSSPSEITLAYLVKPKSSPNNLQLPVAS
ncbi:hypothetical protein D5086_009717, partial [Populus alba]